MFHIRFGNKILCYKRKRMIFVSIQGDNLHKKVGQKNNNCLQIKKCSIFTHFFRPVACGIQHTFEVFSYFVVTEMIQSGLRGSAFAGDVLDEFFDAEIGLIFGEIKRGALGKTEQKFIENVSGQVELSHFFLKDLDKC